MDFMKMEGLGNDFVVVDGPFAPSPEQVATWSDRRRGIGADGVLVVTPMDGSAVGMGYWNADGSAAEMCGNGLRCVARHALDSGMVDGPEFTVQTPIGPRSVHVGAEVIRAELGPVRVDDSGPTIAGYDFAVVSVGNPHAVAFVDDTYSVPIDVSGPLVETDSAFPERTNVEFATIASTEEIHLRVWERGVGETLACGTGAAATAAAAQALGLTGSRVSIHLPGGTLVVELVDGVAWIEGPAVTVFSGTLPD